MHKGLAPNTRFTLGARVDCGMNLSSDSRPRWFILSSTLLAIFALSFFGRFYHQWLTGIGVAIAITVVTNLLYSLIQSRVSRPPRRPVYEQSVIVRLSPPQQSASTEPEEDLWTLETLLTDVIERQGLGEFDGNEVGEDGATLFMYGSNAEDLFRGVEATLRGSSLCENARVQIRPGPPGTVHREVRL